MTLLQHARILALTLADGQLLLAVVPLESDGGVGTLLVVVVVAFVLIEREATIGTRIDAHLEVIPSLLANILHLRTEGKDAACTYEHRHAVECGLEGHVLSTLVLLVGPEVIPGSTLWQVLCGGLRGGEVYASYGGTIRHRLAIPACHSIRADNLFLCILCLHDGGS